MAVKTQTSAVKDARSLVGRASWEDSAALWMLKGTAVAVLLVIAYFFLKFIVAAQPALAHFGIIRFIFMNNWDVAHNVFGAWPLVAGTLITSALALLLGVPVAVAAALYRAWPAPTASPGGAQLARVGCAIAFAGVQLAAGAQLLAGRRGMPLTLEYPAPLRGFAIATASGWLVAVVGAALIGANLVAAAQRRI